MKKLMILISVLILTCCSSFGQVYKFKSTETDIEKTNGEVITKYETCYHTFDYNKSEVIFEGVSSDGKKTKHIYKIKRMYQEGVTSVLVINDKGMKEIWFSVAMNNLGYDLLDGTRLACYGITKVY